MKKHFSITLIIAALLLAGCKNEQPRVESVKQDSESVTQQVAEKTVDAEAPAIAQQQNEPTAMVPEPGQQDPATTPAPPAETVAVVPHKTESTPEPAPAPAVEPPAPQKTAEPAKAMSAMEGPEIIVIDNEKGPVTLPHKKHGETLGCATCHAEAAPGPLELGKDAAHKLCKECHKEKGAGPTGCSECHGKKASRKMEGC